MNKIPFRSHLKTDQISVNMHNIDNFFKFRNSLECNSTSKVGNMLKLTEKMITSYRPMKHCIMAFDLHQIICLLPFLRMIFQTQKKKFINKLEITISFSRLNTNINNHFLSTNLQVMLIFQVFFLRISVFNYIKRPPKSKWLKVSINAYDMCTD